MAVITTNVSCDLKEVVKVQYLSGNLFSQDNQANVINVTVTDGGEPATISGTVTANIIREDGGTVTATGGTISGNVVSITLPAAAYIVPGLVSIVVKLTASSVVTTLAAVVANVYQSSTETAVDPGTIIPSVTALVSQIETAVASIPADYSSLWTSLAPAFSTSATYAPGQYVTNGGALYVCTAAHTGSWVAGHFAATNLGAGLSDLKSDFGFYDVLKYEIPSVSSIGEYWNNEINANIPQGSKLHLEFLGYTGTKLVKVRFIAYNSQGTTTTLLDTLNSGRNYADVVTAEEYTKILIQTQRSSAENGVSASFFMRGDFAPGVGKDYYGLSDEIGKRVSKDGIAEVTINNTQFLKTKNIFNPNGIVEGYLWTGDAPETNQNYCYTQRIYNVKPSTTYAVSTNGVSAWQMFYTAWNASGSRIGAGNVGTYSGQTNTFTTPANTVYVIFSAATVNKNLIMVEEGSVPTIFEAYGTVAHPTVRIEGMPLVLHVEKDGSGDFDSLVDCINYINNNVIMDAVVYVGDGTWDIIDELGSSYIESVSNTKRGLYLQNRVHIICSSKSKIVCDYTGTRADTITWLSAFNAGQYGFTLENATIESSKCRYAIHDERDSATDSYKNEYINCKITHDNTNGGNIQCIGGGLGTDGYIVIKGCIFSNPNLGEQGANFSHLVSYHNSWGIGRSFIECAGNYLDGIGTFKFSWFGGSTELTPIICHNNSIGSAVKVVQETTDTSVGVPVDIENIDVKQWNNVIRQ